LTSGSKKKLWPLEVPIGQSKMAFIGTPTMPTCSAASVQTGAVAKYRSVHVFSKNPQLTYLKCDSELGASGGSLGIACGRWGPCCKAS
jgi:hypothetical protein